MIKILQSIWGGLETVFAYFFDFIENSIILLRVVFESLALPPFLSPYLPSFLAVSMTFMVGVSVIKLILGRQ